ncbi:MAG: hypothetical protein HGB10_09555 [Coriobacteriia bacterium]|nr:hypothetical protein [Coriobacteriia bacterium]
MTALSGSLMVELLIAAAGVAFNPPAIISATILASSSRRTALAFAGGWLAGLLIIGSAAMLMGDVSALSSEPSRLRLMLKLAVGTLLILLAAAKRRKKSSAADEEMPRWMRSLSELSAPRAFLAAAAYASLNPKTLAFVIAGVLAILGGSTSIALEWLVLVVFLATASLSVTLPVAVAVVAPDRSADGLAAARIWLGQNGSAITAGVLAVLGVLLVYGALSGLIPMGR